MFKEFRAIYPQGCIDSELLQAEQPYIVKCSISVGNWLLASGLGSGATVEEAENKARSRALETINLHFTPGMVAPGNVPTPTPAPAINHVNTNSSPAPELTPVATAPITTSMAAPVAAPIPPNNNQPKPPKESPEVFTPLVPELEHDAAEDDSHVEELFNIASESEPTVEDPPEPPAEVAAPPEEIDFNDIISRTNVELKRLNWSNDQGREYLLQTYGKRSRHLLSDDELLEFLQYLQSQS